MVPVLHGSAARQSRPGRWPRIALSHDVSSDMRLLCCFFAAVILSAALIGCGMLGDEPAEPEVDTYFTAQLNGEPWRGYQKFWLSYNMSRLEKGHYFSIGAAWLDSTRYPYYQTFDLYMPSYDINIGLYSVSNYTYNITKGVREGGRFYEMDGDAIIAGYEATADTSNYVRVTSYDSTTGIAEGTFAVIFVAGEDYRGRPRSRFPDTLRFTEGRFRVRPAIHDSTGCLRFCEAPDPSGSD